MLASENLIGLRFGRLTVIQPISIPGGIWRNQYLQCICDCGRQANVRADHVKSGATNSCGCMARELGDAARAGASKERYDALLAERARHQKDSVVKTLTLRAQRHAEAAARKAAREAKAAADKQARAEQRAIRKAEKEASRALYYERLAAGKKHPADRTHNLPRGTYKRLLEQQGGACAICKDPPPPGRRLNVDHCHSTEQVRGLLCSRCNHGLGNFRDNIDFLFGAMAYLVADRPVLLRGGKFLTPTPSVSGSSL